MWLHKNSLFSQCTYMHAAVAPSSVDLSDQSAGSAAAVGVCPPPSHTLPLSGHRQLSRLRRAAFLLYQSQPLCIIISRLEVNEKKLLAALYPSHLWYILPSGYVLYVCVKLSVVVVVEFYSLIPRLSPSVFYTHDFINARFMFKALEGIIISCE